MKGIIKNYLNRNQELRFLLKNLLGKGVVYNYYKTDYEKNCLLMYVLRPFLDSSNDLVHQAYWQQKELARIISEHRYNIDIIDYNNTSIKLKNKYDLVIDLIPGNNPAFKEKLNPGCKTIAYLTGSNATFQNAAEMQRLQNLKNRHGVMLKPRRQSPILTKEIEDYSACFMIGNEYNWKTYSNFNIKKYSFIKNTGHEQEYRYDINKKDKKSFLYFGSSGQVHKGLDLLLDVFSKDNFPCDLYVCGTFKDEKDFDELFHKELYECKNIHAIGFVRIGSSEFSELTDKCVWSIMPSCSEGIAGSVLTTMSAGLINICSRECGFEDDEVIHLDNCEIDTINDIVIRLSRMDDSWIKEKSKQSYCIIRERYSKACFVESVERALNTVI